MKKIFIPKFHNAILIVVLFLAIGYVDYVNASWEIMRQASFTTQFEDIFFIDKNKGWAVGWADTIVQTTDGGSTWVKKTNIPNYRDDNYLMGRQFQGVFFYDTNNGWIVGDHGSILSTKNGGDTWDEYVVDGAYFYDVFFINSLEGWIVGSSILNTKDGGVTWQEQKQADGFMDYFLEVKFISPTTGWVIDRSENILKTIDGGINWDSLTTPESSRYFDIEFINSSQGWLSTLGSLYHTNDSGNNWDIISNHLNSYPSYPAILFNSETNGVGFNRNSIGYTTNGGISWTSSNINEKVVHLTGMSFINEMEGWISGYGGYIGYTADGGRTWVDQTKPYCNDVLGFYFINDAKGWITTYAGGLFSTSDGGISWILENNHYFYTIFFIDEHNGWALNYNAIYSTSDGGKNWKEIFKNDGLINGEIYFNDHENGWIETSSDTLFYTKNGGADWVANKYQPTTVPDFKFYKVFSFEHIWMVNYKYNNEFFWTNDAGINWNKLIIEDTNTFKSVSPINQNIIYALGENNFLFKTIDGGSNWENLGEKNYESVLFVDENHGWIYSYSGSQYTEDGGNDWYEYNGFMENFRDDIIWKDLLYAGGDYIWGAGRFGTVARAQVIIDTNQLPNTSATLEANDDSGGGSSGGGCFINFLL